MKNLYCIFCFNFYAIIHIWILGNMAVQMLNEHKFQNCENSDRGFSLLKQSHKSISVFLNSLLKKSRSIFSDLDLYWKTKKHFTPDCFTHTCQLLENLTGEKAWKWPVTNSLSKAPHASKVMAISMGEILENFMQFKGKILKFKPKLGRYLKIGRETHY